MTDHTDLATFNTIQQDEAFTELKLCFAGYGLHLCPNIGEETTVAGTKLFPKPVFGFGNGPSHGHSHGDSQSTGDTFRTTVTGMRGHLAVAHIFFDDRQTDTANKNLYMYWC